MLKRPSRDKKLRKNYKKLELNYIFLKCILNNENLHYRVAKYKLVKNTIRILQKTLLKSTRIKKYCVYTGRARGTFSFSKLSRFEIRKLNIHNLIPGLLKAS